MRHEMRLHNEPFEQIKNHKKTIEIRLYDEKRKALHKGDIITFTNRSNNEKIDCTVTDIKRFDTFEELFNNYNKVELGYNENEDANPNDLLKYYTEEEIKKYGVVAIHINYEF